MASAIFGKHWYEKSEDERDEAMACFRAAVTAARSGTDEAIRQNMVCFDKIVPGAQEVCLGLRHAVENKEAPTAEDAARWYSLMKKVNRAINERIFVVMTAQTKGWSFAKDLDFYQSGEEASEHYQKVAKLHAKKEEAKKEKERDDKKPRRGGGFGRPRYSPYPTWAAPPMPPMYPMWPPPTMPSPMAPQASAAASRPSRAHLRCNNCAEFGKVT